jgi:hypothetical protein
VPTHSFLGFPTIATRSLDALDPLEVVAITLPVWCQIVNIDSGNYVKYSFTSTEVLKGAFTPNVKSVLSENLGGILGGNQC